MMWRVIYRDNEYIFSHSIIYYVEYITMTAVKYEPYCIVILNDCLAPLYSRYHKKFSGLMIQIVLGQSNNIVEMFRLR